MSEAIDRTSRIYVAGHRGMVGSALVRKLHAEGYTRIITRPRSELDLTDQAAVRAFFDSERPDYVFLAAARVGGILANDTYRADFIYQNLIIACNVIEAAFRADVERLLFLGSSCIYPRECPQPIREEYLLTGPFEPTNEPYAIAKIAGLKLCESFNRQYGTRYVSVMPTNLYGPNDNFDLAASHVLPALLRKAHTAKLDRSPVLAVWGSGRPRREFLHVDDLAAACVMLMTKDVGEGVYNVGTGTDVTIAELANCIKDVVGLDGELAFDAGKPDGTPRKLLDIARIRALGWKPRFDLEAGIRDTYRWCLDNAVFERAANEHRTQAEVR
ncbi:MAG TPA: GDP-L-fucose synthase [Burkholderiales bacterium]|nr:GDP-L-fucose synthase [Burkholderiales bacterium]